MPQDLAILLWLVSWAATNFFAASAVPLTIATVFCGDVMLHDISVLALRKRQRLGHFSTPLILPRKWKQHNLFSVPRSYVTAIMASMSTFATEQTSSRALRYEIETWSSLEHRARYSSAALSRGSLLQIASLMNFLAAEFGFGALWHPFFADMILDPPSWFLRTAD